MKSKRGQKFPRTENHFTHSHKSLVVNTNLLHTRVK